MEYETLKTLIEMALLHLRVHLCVKARGAELGAHTQSAPGTWPTSVVLILAAPSFQRSCVKS